MSYEKLARPTVLTIKPYVPGKPIEEVERELGITNVIKMASNENPLGPSPKAIAAMAETAKKAQLYPDGNCYYLKQVLAQKLGVDIDNLIVGNGSDEIIKLLAEAFLNPDEEVLTGNPSFSEYIYATSLMGGKAVLIDLKDYTFDLEKMAEAITDKTKLIFICNPNNPTGTINTKAELDAFMAKVPEDVIVVFDEAYFEYVDAKDYPDTMEYIRAGRKVIILRTFSKIHGLAGLRIGYGIASPEFLAVLNRVREPFNVNLLAQEAALASLQDDNHIEQSRAVNYEGKAYLYKEFARMGLKYVPTQANFIFVDVQKDSKEVFQAMMKKGVIIRTGDIFGLPTHIRVTVGKPEENERFIKTLEEVI